MSLEIIEEKQNSLLGRREAKLVVHHEGQGTPDRITVRKLASQHFNADFDRVYVRSISTRTGGSSAICVVEVYQDKKSAEVVPDYLKNRNLPKDQRVSKKKKEAEEKPVAPTPKPATEKKAEAKPAEKKEDTKPAPAKAAKPEVKEEKPAAKEAKPAKPEKPKA